MEPCSSRLPATIQASALTLAVLFKKCPNCGPLPRSEFYRNKARPDGLQSTCKICHAGHVDRHQQANRPALLSARRARYWSDPDIARDTARVWARDNRSNARAAEARYRASHPWKHRCKSARRRARMTTECFTWNNSAAGAAIEDKYALADLMSRLFREPYEVDHRVALSNGGQHHPANLDIITRTENRRKGDKTAERDLPS